MSMSLGTKETAKYRKYHAETSGRAWPAKGSDAGNTCLRRATPEVVKLTLTVSNRNNRLHT